MKSLNSILISTLTFASFSAFALNNQPIYLEECLVAAIPKLEQQAIEQGLQFNAEDIQVSEIDDRWYNPQKYVWFEVEAFDEAGNTSQLSTITQKSYLPLTECF